MSRLRGRFRAVLCALSVLASCRAAAADAGDRFRTLDGALHDWPSAIEPMCRLGESTPTDPILRVSWITDPFVEGVAQQDSQAVVLAGATTEEPLSRVNDDPPRVDQPTILELPTDLMTSDYDRYCDWAWRWTPTGLIYHSYMAGPHEPRMAIAAFYDGESRALWDPTLGGRVGLVRYGNNNPLHTQGYQLDFYGAAIARLDVDHREDLDSCDYVFGFPLTYGCGDWQIKFGYAHTSSHLGDERAIRLQGSLAERINYVRDGVVFGVSHYPYYFWRQYSEVGWAFNTDGGAQPWDAQFGAEFSKPGVTGSYGTPFFAMNAHLLEEHDWGGNFALQTGMLRRGIYGQTLRVGIHFLTGSSSQFQFFKTSEEQIGLGIWYDM